MSKQSKMKQNVHKISCRVYFALIHYSQAWGLVWPWSDWEKLVFTLLVVSVENNFLVRSGTPCPLQCWNPIWLEPLWVLCVVSRYFHSHNTIFPFQSFEFPLLCLKSVILFFPGTIVSKTSFTVSCLKPAVSCTGPGRGFGVRVGWRSGLPAPQ